MSLSRDHLSQLAGTEEWYCNFERDGEEWIDVYQCDDIVIEMSGSESPPTVTILAPSQQINSFSQYKTLFDISLKHGFQIKLWDDERTWEENNASYSDLDKINDLFNNTNSVTVQPAFILNAKNTSRRDVKHYVKIIQTFKVEYEEFFNF